MLLLMMLLPKYASRPEVVVPLCTCMWVTQTHTAADAKDNFCTLWT